jgi:hypothetical protein
MNTRAVEGPRPGAAQAHQRRHPGLDQRVQRRHRAEQPQPGRPLLVDLLDRTALDGRDEPVLAAEVVADGAGVRDAGCAQDVAHGRGCTAPFGQQALGGVEQPLPGCALVGHCSILL